jgi:hypothetical protein
VPLQVWSGVAQLIAAVPGPGRLELTALRVAGAPLPSLTVEAYDANGLVAGGEVTLWELNQAIAALLASTTQARRWPLRDRRPGHGGHLDLVVDGRAVELVVTAGERRAGFATTTQALVGDLNALVRHYLALTRTNAASRTIVLPDVSSAVPAPR